MISQVSVLLPTISVDAWLDEAVWSILNSADVEIELLVIFDGCQPDYSRDWISDPRIRLIIHDQRVGLPTGLMSGLTQAKHELIGRLDADDVAEKNRLSKQAKFLQENPNCVAVGSRVRIMDERGVLGNEIRYPVGPDIRKELILQNVVPHPGSMFRKSASAQIGGYDVTLKNMEDYDFWLRMATEGEIANLDEVLTFYRVHSGQMSRGAKPFGPYINQVLASKSNLARKLNYSRTRFLVEQLIWLTVQYLRYFRVIKPGYKRKFR